MQIVRVRINMAGISHKHISLWSFPKKRVQKDLNNINEYDVWPQHYFISWKWSIKQQQYHNHCSILWWKSISKSNLTLFHIPPSHHQTHHGGKGRQVFLTNYEKEGAQYCFNYRYVLITYSFRFIWFKLI